MYAYFFAFIYSFSKLMVRGWGYVSRLEFMEDLEKKRTDLETER
jgi:hypothetical protein